MKKKVAVFLILLIAGSLLLVSNLGKTNAMNPPATQWSQIYNLTTYYVQPGSVFQTADGGYAFAGAVSGIGYEISDCLLIKANSFGTELWNKTTFQNVGASAYLVVQTTDGGYAEIDAVTLSRSLSSYIIKTDSAGNQLWNYMYPEDVQVSSIMPTKDGGTVLGGTGDIGSDGGTYIWLGKVDSMGSQQWQRSYETIPPFGNFYQASSIIQTSDGGFIIAGQQRVSGVSSGLIIKTDVLGNEIWNRTYSDYTSLSSIVQTTDGGYALTNGAELIKLDSQGNEQWNQQYGFSISSLVQSNDGGYAVVGENSLVKTDSSGNTEWFINFNEFAASITLSYVINTSDGGYVVEGMYQCGSSGNYVSDLWLAKVAPSQTTPTLPFTDNFANLNAWTIVDGTWTLFSGGVMGASSTEALMYAGSRLWTDYQVIAPVTISAGGEASIVFRFQDSNDYYWAGIGCFGNQYAIGRNINGIQSEVDGSGTASSNGAGTYTLEVLAQGSTFTLFLNSVPVLIATDSTFASGAIGLRTFGNVMRVGSLSYGPAVDWPMFHDDLGHSGYSTAAGPTINPAIQWSYTTGGPIEGSSPAVANGVTYVGSDDHNLYAFNANTGVLLWSYKTGGDVESSPAVAGGIVYLGSYDHNIYALNANTGALLWNYTTGGGINSSPAVSNGLVYVGSDDAKVYCLDANTGGLVWSYTTGYSIYSSPAVVNGNVYVGSYDGRIYCLNATTGGLTWSYLTGGLVESSPAVAGGMVYAGSGDHKLYALNATTGSFLWSYTMGAGIAESSPAIAEGMVYIGSMDDKVYCLNSNTGTPVWSYATGSFVQSSPIVAGGMVYFGSDDNKVYCLNANSGNLVWSFATGNTVYCSPSVANGMLYIGSSDNKVYCFCSSTLTMPFADNFANLNNWGIDRGTWTTANNVLSAVPPPVPNNGIMHVNGGGIWTDYTANITVSVPTSMDSATPNVDLLFRFQDSNNFYWAGFGSFGYQYSIGKSFDGVYSLLANSGTAPSNSAGTYKLCVVVVGQSISFYVNNILVLQAADSSFSVGGIGLLVYENSVSFNSLSVTPLAGPTPTPSPNPTSAPTPTPSPSTLSLPFQDNFANANNWIIDRGTWTTANNLLSSMPPAIPNNGIIHVNGGVTWTDYTANITVSVPSSVDSVTPNVDLLFRFQDSNNFYWVGFGSLGHQYSMGKAVNGLYSPLTNSGIAPSNSAGTYKLSAVVVGQAISFYVNNNLVLQATDSSFSAGGVGLLTYENSVTFNSLTVTPMTSPAPSPSPTPTPTPTPSATPTPTTSPSPTPSSTTSPTPTTASTPTPVTTVAPTQAPTQTPTLAPTQTSTEPPVNNTNPTPTTPEFPPTITAIALLVIVSTTALLGLRKVRPKKTVSS